MKFDVHEEESREDSI